MTWRCPSAGNSVTSVRSSRSAASCSARAAADSSASRALKISSMAALAAFNACPACFRASGSRLPKVLRAATSGERLPVIAVRTALSSSTVVAAPAWRSASTTNCSGSAIGLHYGNPRPSTPHQMASIQFGGRSVADRRRGDLAVSGLRWTASRPGYVNLAGADALGLNTPRRRRREGSSYRRPSIRRCCRP